MRRAMMLCAAVLCLTMTLAPTALAAGTNEVEICYPTAITQSEDGTELRKLYDLGPEDDPTGIPRSDFEQDGFHYTLTDLLRQELPEHDETYELHRLLGALLSQELTVDEKLSIIGNEYDIPIGENMRKDVSAMCNLGEGIEEKGIAIGRETGRIEGEAGLIIKMHKNGLSAEQIASATDKEIAEVKAIIAGRI